MPNLTRYVSVVAALFAAKSAHADDMALQRCIWACLAAHGPNTNPAYHQCVVDQCTPDEPEDTAETPVSPPAPVTPSTAPAATVTPVPTTDGTWGDVTGLITTTLGGTGTGSTYFWLPDSSDPTAAMQAVALSYDRDTNGGPARPRGALFLVITDHFAYAGPVDGILGIDPRDAQFSGRRIELSTTLPGGEEARWSIEVATNEVTRIR